MASRFVAREFCANTFCANKFCAKGMTRNVQNQSYSRQVDESVAALALANQRIAALSETAAIPEEDRQLALRAWEPRVADDVEWLSLIHI